MAVSSIQVYGPTGFSGYTHAESLETVQANDTSSVSPSLSVTVIVAVPMPVAVGVPATSRVASFMAMPAGRPLAE